MKKLSLTLLISIFLSYLPPTYLFSENVDQSSAPTVVPGVLIVKLKPHAHISTLRSRILSSAAPLPITRMTKVFPHHQRVSSLSRIFEIHFPGDISPWDMMNRISSWGIFEYIEPKYVCTMLSTIPNDSLIDKQFYLDQISMFRAWFVEQGASEIIIAIVDNGTDYLHPDLASHIWINLPEAQGSPGVDDDGNGYIDDLHGWDFAEQDNDPRYGMDESIVTVHGTHTAGIASAVTNNTTGIAGVGWNCTIMPIKISTDEDAYETPFGYEGMVYAADNGAHIINCSWGRRGSFSQYEQDIINYVANKGCLIVAAGGNANSETTYYPAAYVHVIAVAAVNERDEKTSYSSYGKFIDVSAPGGDRRIGRPGIFSLYPVDRGAYGELSGTSMSCPMVAGILGLMKHHFPEFSPFQLTRQLILTADDITHLNADYEGLFGFGRVNGFRALIKDVTWEEPAKIALFKTEVHDAHWGNGNHLFERNEIIGVDVWYRNFAVSAGEQFVVSLSAEDEDILIVQDRSEIDLFPADTILSFTNQLRFLIKPEAKPHLTTLLLNYSLVNGESGCDSIDVLIGRSSILLVDDDNGTRNVEKFYSNLLDQLSVPYLRWDHTRLGTPSPELIVHFPMIIWCCEWAFPSLSPQDRIALQHYLDNKGSLFISGQDIGWDLADPTGTENNQYSESTRQFYRNYLHARYRDDNAFSTHVRGEPGSLGKGLQFPIFQPGIPYHFQFPDWIEPGDEAELCFRYESGKGAGIIYLGEHRLLYLGFGFEAVDGHQHDDPARFSRQRYELMIKILNQLGPLTHQEIGDLNQVTDTILFRVDISSAVNDLQHLFLFWKTDDMTEYAKSSMYRGDDDSYHRAVDLRNYQGIISYYFQLTTPYYQYTLPVTGEHRPFTFEIGADHTKPEIYHLPLQDILIQNHPRDVSVFMEDNMAVDSNSVWLHYRSADVEDSVKMVAGDDHWFLGKIPPLAHFGDSISYYFSARDKAVIPNQSTSDIFSYKVGSENFEYGTDSWITDANTWELDNSQFHSEQFSISTFPGQAYDNDINCSLQARYGLKRRDLKDIMLKFWTKYELERLRDFGVVEISDNHGKNWHILGLPLTGIQKPWEQRSIDLGQYYADSNDTLLLRFRMKTDANQDKPLAGWFLDDIELCVSTVSQISGEDIFSSVLPPVEIASNRPNPFNESTHINFTLHHPATVNYSIYNITGQCITTGSLGKKLPGNYQITWNGKDKHGIVCGNGIYFCRINVKFIDSFVQYSISRTIKMIYLK